MKQIADVAGAELRWQRLSALAQRYGLRALGAVVATLAFRSTWASWYLLRARIVAGRHARQLLADARPEEAPALKVDPPA